MCLLQIQNQFKIHHWQTISYARHKAYGKMYDTLADKIDTLVETNMGKYGRVKLDGKQTITLCDMADMTLSDFLKMIEDTLIEFNSVLDKVNDSDLLNQRDDILGSLNQLKYMLTLE